MTFPWKHHLQQSIKTGTSPRPRAAHANSFDIGISQIKYSHRMGLGSKTDFHYFPPLFGTDIGNFFSDFFFLNPCQSFLLAEAITYSFAKQSDTHKL